MCDMEENSDFLLCVCVCMGSGIIFVTKVIFCVEVGSVSSLRELFSEAPALHISKNVVKYN